MPHPALLNALKMTPEEYGRIPPEDRPALLEKAVHLLQTPTKETAAVPVKVDAQPFSIAQLAMLRDFEEKLLQVIDARFQSLESRFLEIFLEIPKDLQP